MLLLAVLRDVIDSAVQKVCKTRIKRRGTKLRKYTGSPQLDTASAKRTSKHNRD
jgi:hypothetical protein